MDKFKQVLSQIKKQTAQIKHFNKIISVILIILAVILLVEMIFFRETDIKTAEVAQQNELLAQKIRQYYSQRPDYWGLSTKTVINNKIAPAEMITAQGLRNAYNAEVLVGNGINGDIVMPGSRSFDVVYKNLNRRQCMELASYGYSEKYLLGLNSITINSEKSSNTFNWGEGKTLPLSAKEAKKKCGLTNTLLWHYE